MNHHHRAFVADEAAQPSQGADGAQSPPGEFRPGAWAMSAQDGVITIHQIEHVTDYAPIINAALRVPGVTEVRLGAGLFPVSSPVYLPSGAHLTGAGAGETMLVASPDFAGPSPSALVKSEYRATDIVLADFSVDASKLSPEGLRLNGVFMDEVAGFQISRVDVHNVTGYAHFARGDVTGLQEGEPDALPTSGSYTDCRTFNAQVHFEVMYGDGVSYTDCAASDGDGDISTEAYFHPLLASRNIDYLRCTAIGDGFIGFSLISTTQPLEHISIVDSRVEITRDGSGYGFLDHSGLPTLNLRIENSTFISHDYIGFSGYRISGSATNSVFQGGVFGMALDNDDDTTPLQFIVTGSHALAVSDPNLAAGIAGLDATAGLVWIGGEIEARGSGGLMFPVTGGGDVSDETVLIDDGYLTRVGYNGASAETRLFPAEALPDAGFGGFPGGSITAAFRAFSDSGDVLRIAIVAGSGLAVQGGQINFNGVKVGTVSGGSGGEPLIVTLGAAASAQAVEAIVHAIAYFAGGVDPGAAPRLIEIDIVDGAGVSGSLNTAVHMGQIVGGFDNAVYIVGSETTGIVEAANGGIDEVRTTLGTYVLPANLENLVFVGLGSAHLRGNLDGNRIEGGNGSDLIDLRDGGGDSASGGGGDDGFYFGAAMDPFDAVDGGTGIDQIGLQGVYAGLTLGAGATIGVEFVVLLPGNDNRFGGATGTDLSYTLTTTDANIAAGHILTFQANTLRAGEQFTLNGSAETDGAFLTFGGLGTENLTGGQQGDGFYFGTGRFNPGDLVDGQSGSDQFALQGDYAGANALTLGAGQLANIEFIVLMSAADARFGRGNAGQSFSYAVTTHDGNVAAGQQLVVQANTLRASEVLSFDGSAELDGSFLLYGGAAADTIAGGAQADALWGNPGADRIEGRGGADILRGGADADLFVYRAIGDSTAAASDRILDFTTGDVIDLANLDANAGAPGRQDFALIGSGSAFTAAGQLRITQVGTSALVEGEVDGDGVADFAIQVTVIDGHMLTGADFLGVGDGFTSGLQPAKAFGQQDDWRWLAALEPVHHAGLIPTSDLTI